MKILRNSLIFSCIIFQLWSCCGETKENTFLAKYQYEDFLQFKGIQIYKRGGNKYHHGLAMIVSYQHNDSLKEGLYVVFLNKENYQVVEASWASKYYVDSDTLKLQQLAQTFVKYNLPRLKVDNAGNVFVYLKDIDTLALVKFANENEKQKRSKEVKWIRVKENWYKSKY